MTTISKAVAEAFFFRIYYIFVFFKISSFFFVFRFEIWVSVCNESKKKSLGVRAYFFGRASSSISLLTQKLIHFNFLSWDQHLMMKSLQLYHYCVYHNNQETVVFLAGWVALVIMYFFSKVIFFWKFFSMCEFVSYVFFFS